jgi:predicted Zn-dependent protease
MNEKSTSRMSADQARLALQRIVFLAQSGDLSAAATAAGSIADSVVATEAWRVLSEMNANSQRWTEARSCLEIALQHQPISRPLRLQHALLLQQEGADAAALRELSALAAEGRDSPQLLACLADALQYAQRPEEAEAQLEAGLHRWPTDPALHSQLARLRWQQGALARKRDHAVSARTAPAPRRRGAAA